MTALAVMRPAAPSTGPGLKPNDCSLVWTSLTSSRRSGVWFGTTSTGAGWPAAAESALASAGSWAEATLAGGDGDDGAGGDDFDSGGTGSGVAAAISTDDAGSVRVAALGENGIGGQPSIGPRLTMAEPTTAPIAKPSTNLIRRARARSYARRAARRAAFAASGSIARCRAARSASLRDSSLIDRLKISSP